jgi:hypothetical protein
VHHVSWLTNIAFTAQAHVCTLRLEGSHHTRNLLFKNLSSSFFFTTFLSTPTAMSSSTPVRIPERDQQMLAVGRQCSHPSCLLVDFLPFKCQHCADSFCADHFKPASHSCTKYDESKYNRVAPDCKHFSFLHSIPTLILSRSSL